MKIRMGVSGVKGSFSEEAAQLYAKRASIHPAFLYLIDMEGVLSAIESNEIDLGIFPVVNLQGGLVKPALEAMGKYLFKPIDEQWLDVKQCLMALPNITVNEITNIVSHSQGLAQCKHYLDNEFKEVKQIEWCNTAKAAQDLQEGILESCTAVIAPERAAQIYNLHIIAKNIQDITPNLTAFIVVEKRR